jgi:hypothetical protein
VKIGVICEGANTDEKTLNLIFGHHFRTEIARGKATFEVRGHSKREIFSQSDIILADMFQNRGVDKALIIWDLLPAGVRMGVASQWSERPNRKEQRNVLLRTLCESEHLPLHLREHARYLNHKYCFWVYDDLDSFKKPSDYFCLVCVCYALDGWLLAEPEILRDLASSKNRQAETFGNQRPEECQKPAVELQKYFVRGSNKRFHYYNKTTHNPIVAKTYCDQGKLHIMRHEAPSFARVLDTIEGWLR